MSKKDTSDFFLEMITIIDWIYLGPISEIQYVDDLIRFLDIDTNVWVNVRSANQNMQRMLPKHIAFAWTNVKKTPAFLHEKRSNEFKRSR